MAKVVPENNKVNFPAVDFLEKRFLFIADDILRENIAIAFQYIIFLIGLKSDHGVHGPVEYSRNKDIILYAGTIVESCLHYVISEYLRNKLTKNNDIMSWEWKHDKCLSLYKIPGNDSCQEVCGVIRHKKYERFNDMVGFKQLNGIAFKLGILNKGLLEDAEYIREQK